MDDKNSPVTALIAYPLSERFCSKIAKIFQIKVEYVNLQQIKANGLWGILKQLRQIKGQLILPLEDPTSVALLPLLQFLSLFTASKSVLFINHDCVVYKLSQKHHWVAALKFIWASVANHACLLKTYLTLPTVRQNSTFKLDHKNSPKVLFINANLWFGIKAGGSVGHIAGVCNAMVKQGYDVTYAAVEPNLCLDKKVKFLLLKPLKMYGLPYEANLYRFNFMVTRQLEAWLTKNKVDFIYQRLSLANMSGAQLVHRFKLLPLVVEYNGSEAWIAKNWGKGLKFQKLAEKVEQKMLQAACRIVTVSKPLAEQITCNNVNRDRVVVYPNGIDPELFNPSSYTSSQLIELRQRYDIPEHATIGMFVGTYGVWHGVSRLAEALVKLSKNDLEWFKKNQFYFFFVGDGFELPIVKQLIHHSEISSYCRFTGLIPQFEAAIYLAVADILFSPHQVPGDTRFFGSPTKIFEYMAMGKAIIASDLEQIGEVLRPALLAKNLTNVDLEQQVNSILCQPGSIDDMIIALTWLVANPAWQTKLGVAARQKVLNNYTWSHHVKHILEPTSTGEE